MLYSWGSGDNFVLGNMDETPEHTPYELDDFDFIRSELRGDAVAISLGYNHVCLVTSKNEGLCPLDESVTVKRKEFQKHGKGRRPLKPKNQPKEEKK